MKRALRIAGIVWHMFTLAAFGALAANQLPVGHGLVAFLALLAIFGAFNFAMLLEGLDIETTEEKP